MPWGHCPPWYGIPSSFKVTACHIFGPPLNLHLSKCSYEMLSNKGFARLQECMHVARGYLPASTPQPQQSLTSSHMPSPCGFLLPCKVTWRLWKGQRYTLGDRERPASAAAPFKLHNMQFIAYSRFENNTFSKQEISSTLNAIIPVLEFIGVLAVLEMNCVEGYSKQLLF